MNKQSTTRDYQNPAISRRSMMARSVASVAAAGALATGASATSSTAIAEEVKAQLAIPDGPVKNKRIRQSVMGWCFNPMPTPELLKHCRDIGLVAVEGISSEHYDAAKELGLEISLVSSHGFKNGPVDPENRAACVAKLRESIDLAVKYGSPSVITFTGMSVKGMTDEVADKNCVDCWKEIIGYAEEKKINLVLEHLNSRDDSHPMKGHPGYYGDDVDHCVDLIRKVDSPNMKLLFDVYHVQVMNGDVMRRIDMYQDVIGHYHTAGNPGRGELDDTQEINYPPIMRKILATGYKGYVAQEFIPTWDDKVKALRHAAHLCDV